jgi:WXXGXW repeat (2 copies)
MTSGLPFLRTGLYGLAALFSFAPCVSAADPPAKLDGVEVLARGPVHEAFAQPASGLQEPGPVAPKEPPKPIDELPPDQRPEGDNVQWIPGYWSWDDDGSDYVWVSGLWRMAPADRRWLPGHWQAIDKGWQWVAGFWAAASLAEVQYLPAPPASLDQGPSASAPDDNSTYVPGLWTYQQSRYYWRPGFWVGNQPNWVWSPASYTWTPTGYLYNDGYWDRPLDQRGLLFAPVRFGSEWGGQPYTPQYVVSPDFLLGALFVRSSGQQYYFGDYFDTRYATSGYQAWPDYRIGRNGYDPNYAYYRNRYAAEPLWEPALRDLYRARLAGEVARPPQTLLQQIQVVNSFTGNKTGGVAVLKNINLTNAQNVTALAPLKEVHDLQVTALGSLSQAKETKVPAHVVKLEAVPKVEHARDVKVAGLMRDAAQERRQVEAKMLKEGGGPVARTSPPKTVRLTLPGAPPVVTAPRPILKAAPPPPAAPKHEDRAVPEAKDPPGRKKDTDSPPPKKQVDRPPPKKGPPDKNDDPPAVKKAESPVPPKADPPPMKDPPKTVAPPPKKGSDKKDKDGAW